MGNFFQIYGITCIIVISAYHRLVNYMADLLWGWKSNFAVALVVRGLLILTSHNNCDVTSCRRYASVKWGRIVIVENASFPCFLWSSVAKPCINLLHGSSTIVNQFLYPSWQHECFWSKLPHWLSSDSWSVMPVFNASVLNIHYLYILKHATTCNRECILAQKDISTKNLKTQTLLYMLV